MNPSILRQTRNPDQTHSANVPDLVAPTEDERRNGWTAESLTEYLQHSAAEEDRMLFDHLSHRRRQRTAVKEWNPLRREY